LIFASPYKEVSVLGKGDKKTKRGKISRGTHGVKRPRKKKKKNKHES
jgi:30S ribosomal protein S31